jgi:alpha-tubulin suppressor-like RCC1 family protein
MRRLLVLTFAAALLVAAACNEGPTSPLSTVPPQPGGLRRELVIPATAPQVSAGGYHVCVIKSDATVACWGRNDFGQSTVPAGLTSVAQLATGGDHTCALKIDGTVICWGLNADGQTDVPVGLTSVVQVTAGFLHTCALKTDQTLVCWGYNFHGEGSVPSGLGNIVQVSAGEYHDCVIKSDATVTCWGNFDAQLWTQPADLESVAMLSAGGYHVCAVKTNSTAVCWGRNDFGQGTAPDGAFSQVAAGGDIHSCGLKTDGTVACWGSNDFGEGSVPVGLASVKQISVGFYFNCALKTDGTVFCWGQNEYNQIDVPAGLNLNSATETTLTSSPSPSIFGQEVTFSATVKTTSDSAAVSTGTVSFVEGGTCSSPGVLLASDVALNGSGHAMLLISTMTVGVHSITACYTGAVGLNGSDGTDSHAISALAIPTTTPQVVGGSYQSCALKSNGTVICWGNNSYLQTNVPVGLSSVAQISSGSAHMCALKTDGTVVCWGDNFQNQATVPAGLNSVAEVSAGGNHTCALKTNGVVECWGYNEVDPTVPLSSPVTTGTQISAGGVFTCAVKSVATVICWGHNAYNEARVPGSNPTSTCHSDDPCEGLSAVVQVKAGGFVTCFLKTDATVGCWGGNGFDMIAPAGLASVKQLTAGAYHACALKTDASVVCWSPAFDPPFTAGIFVPPGLSATQIGAGDWHTCAVKTDGGVACWGRDSEGQSSVPPGLNLITNSTQSITIISIPPTPAFVGGTYLIEATGGVSGNAVTFSSLTTDVCTVAGSTVTLLASGTCTVAANQDGTFDTDPAPQQTQNITVVSPSQSIVFTSSPPSQALTGGSYNVSATGGASGNAVTFSSLTSAVCTVGASTVSFEAAGSCTVAADQAGANGYNAALQVTQVFSISSSGQTINFTSTPPNSALPGGSYTVTATGGPSGNAVTFSSLSTSICTVSASTVSLLAAGTCRIAANQAAGNGYSVASQVVQAFTVNSPNQVLSFTSTPPNPGLAGTIYIVAATGGASGNPVMFTSLTLTVCSVTGSTVNFLKIGTCTIAANQNGGGGFNPATQISQSITVMTTQTIVFTSTPPDPALVGSSYGLKATRGGSGNPVVFSSKTPAVCSVSSTTGKLLAPGTCVIAANQAGKTGYLAAAEVTQTFNVFIAQVVKFTSRGPNNPPVGASYLMTASGGASGNAVVFSSLTPITCTVTGGTAHFIATGKCTVAANQNGTSTYAAAAQVTQSVTVK